MVLCGVEEVARADRAEREEEGAKWVLVGVPIGVEDEEAIGVWDEARVKGIIKRFNAATGDMC